MNKTLSEQPAIKPANGSAVNGNATSKIGVTKPAPLNDARQVTARAIVLGLLLSAGLATLNAWIETAANVHFLGGVHLPFGAVFCLLVLVAVNFLVRLVVGKLAGSGALRLPFSATELLTVYAMTVFAALVSTPGTDNFFLTTGTALFYYATPENNWANMFYQHIPSWWAPGWDGHKFQDEVIRPLYLGGLAPSQIPWHAWTAMLVGWSIFFGLIYLALFFTSLIFRRQWIESEALAFPLIQLPLQMVDVTPPGQPPSSAKFWSDRMMWIGFGIACAFHFLRGMNNFYPDWPILAGFQGYAVFLPLEDRPWNAMGSFQFEYFFGAIGLAYLLTREISFSFWFFFFAMQFQLVIADRIGFMPGALPREPYMGQPLFLAAQSVGAWFGLAGLLLWGARSHLCWMFGQAFGANQVLPGEPFSPRVVVWGWLLCLLGLGAWCHMAGLGLMLAFSIFGIYFLVCLVLTRLVIEGGFIFPQLTFSPSFVLCNALFGAGGIGAGDLTRLAFLQTSLFSDMRANPLPAFMHTLKIAYELKLERRNTRRLLMAVLGALAVGFAITMFVAVATLYHTGGLASYGWFASDGPKGSFNSMANTLHSKDGVDWGLWPWIVVGAGLVFAMSVARSRWLWFPLHPLGYLVAGGYPIRRLWLSFFIGWTMRTLIMKYGGADSAQRMRPLMIGLILGNIVPMVFWMIVGFFKGSQIGYWPA